MLQETGEQEPHQHLGNAQQRPDSHSVCKMVARLHVCMCYMCMKQGAVSHCYNMIYIHTVQTAEKMHAV